MNNFYFNHSTFLNTIYAVDIAIEQHFSSFLLNGDISKVVYSSTDYALRKRSKEDTWRDALIPFMNYKLESIGEGTDRDLSNSTAKLLGIYIPELKKYVRYAPVTLTYDATVWYNQHKDNIYAMNEIIWDNTSETIIDYNIDVKDEEGEVHNLKLFGILGYSHSYDASFSQTDWLEDKKIHANALNFEIQTVILKDGLEAWVPEEVVFEFAHSKGLDPEEYDSVFTFMEEYTEG